MYNVHTKSYTYIFNDYRAFTQTLLSLSLYMYQCIAYRSANVPCACSAHDRQKKASGSLGLGLPTVVSYHMGTGNWTQSSERATSALNHRVIAPAPGSGSTGNSFQMCMCICVSVPISANVCTRAEEGIGSPGIGVTGSCKLPDVGTENETAAAAAAAAVARCNGYE